MHSSTVVLNQVNGYSNFVISHLIHNDIRVLGKTSSNSVKRSRK